jgi:MoxR-like ATPase
MEQDFRFMPEVFRIINGALRLDIDKVRNYTAFLAEKLQNAGDEASAGRLRKLLEESDHQLRPAGATFSKALPVDSESRFPLIERVNLKGLSEPPVILSQPQWDTVNEFVSVAKSHAQSDSTAISLLICGPPGTGKSRLVRLIAQELSLDLYVARLDGLISSFLGSTAKNIRALFEFAGKTPCILFLDEFDAIAKVRGDTQELGELKRVVNSFIQNLDTLGTQSIVVAATNHEELLDAAIWRRFSYRLALSFPSPDQRGLMWAQFLGDVKFAPREINLLVDLSEGFSGSDIREVCLRLQRRRISSNKPPELSDVFQVLQNIAIGEGEDRRFLSQLRGKDEQTIAHVLRERNPKLYSHSALANLTGVSKATAYRRTKGVVIFLSSTPSPFGHKSKPGRRRWRTKASESFSNHGPTKIRLRRAAFVASGSVIRNEGVGELVVSSVDQLVERRSVLN